MAQSYNVIKEFGGIISRSEPFQIISRNDMELISDTGEITITGSGGVSITPALQLLLDSSQAAADAIRIISSDPAGGIDVDAGTGGITIDTTGAISLDAAAASNLNTSVGALTLGGDGVNVAGGSGEIDLTTTGAVDINSGAFTVDGSGAISLDGAAASNFNTSVGILTLGGVGVNIDGGSGEIDLTTTGDVDINSGTFSVDGTGAISLDAAAASNLSTSAGALTLEGAGGVDISATGVLTNVKGTLTVDETTTLSAAVIGGVQIVLDAATDPDLVTLTTLYRSTTSAGNYAVVLTGGTAGQIKTIAMSLHSGTDDVVITPASFLSGTSISLTAAGQGATMQYLDDGTTSGWIVIGNNGATIA